MSEEQSWGASAAAPAVPAGPVADPWDEPPPLPPMPPFALPDTRVAPDPRFLDPLPPAAPGLPAAAAAAPPVVAWGAARPPRRPRWRRAAVAATAVLALSAGGAAVALDGPDPAASAGGRSRPLTPAQAADARAAAASTERATAITALIGTMNDALEAADEKAFTSVVLPGSAVLLAHQQQVFRALQRMPFSQVRYAWAGQRYLTVPGLGSRYPDEAYVAEVARTYTLADWDPEPAQELLGLTFTRSGTDRKWYLAADSDAAEQLPFATDTEPWQVGDVSIASTERVLVVGDPKTPATTRRLATRLDGLVSDVADVWASKSWNGRVVVYAVTDKRFVKAWFGTQASTGRRTESTDPATFDAVVGEVWTSQSSHGPGGDPAGNRMVLTPALIRSKDKGYVDQVLTHELTHVLTDRLGSGPAPVWLVEGAAEYTAVRSGGSSVDGVSALQQRGLTTGEWKRLRSGSYRLTLPTDHRQFYAGDSETVADHYTSAWFTCLYIADHYGEKKLVRLYTRAAELSGSGSPEQAEAKALEEVLGTDRAALVKAASSYARSTRRKFT